MDIVDVKIEVFRKLNGLMEEVKAGSVIPVVPHTLPEFIKYVGDSIERLRHIEITGFFPSEPDEHRQ